MAKKRIGILTGGGDVSPLNAVLEASSKACREYGIELIGFVRGWEGVIEARTVDLLKFHINPRIGGTLLRSSRVNPGKIADGIEQIRKNLTQLNFDGLIVIGGEDTLSNCFSLLDVPQVLISKTIDNDVGQINGSEILNHFTLGFPTAARKISSFVSLSEGLRTTAYSHERIIVVESMGMHAGWLALSSSLGHPDFIVIPEFPLDYESFREQVVKKYVDQQHLIIVVAEGAKFADRVLHQRR